nr:MAG TPA: hypothetical protein [Caudoviricetes sp.]
MHVRVSLETADHIALCQCVKIIHEKLIVRDLDFISGPYIFVVRHLRSPHSI